MSRQSRRVTLKNIADETGYSVNTVSRALSGKSDISAETRAHIQKEAEVLGYIPDTVAVSMRSGTTRTIALILGDISNPFFSAQVKEAERRATEHGYTIVILNTDEDSERERSAILSAYGKRADGIIICPVQKDMANMKLLQDIGIPFVLLGRDFKDFNADSVVWDNVKAGELAAAHLIELGHRVILYIGGPTYISSAEERLQGFLEAHRKAGIMPVNSLVRQTDIMSGACMREIKRVIEEGLRFTAIVTFSDLMAYEAVRTMREVSCVTLSSVPIVGIDDIQSKIMLPIAISSVGCTEGTGAVQAVDLLMQKLKSETHAEQRIVLDVQLVHHNI